MKSDTEIEPIEEKKIRVYDFLGYSIFAGCNARANEKLVSGHKALHPACLWLHVLGRKGPHVVVCLGTKQKITPDMVVLRYAASRALRLAGLKEGKVAIAPLEDVYKPEQGQDGIYRTWRTEQIEL